MQKNSYHISGMHCRSCELRIEQALGALPNVHSVRAHQRRGTVELVTDGTPPSLDAISHAVARVGYRLGADAARPWLSRDPLTYFELLLSAVLVGGVYLFFRSFDFFGISLAQEGTPSFGGAIIVGLTAGISTCMAVVGGLTAGFSARFAEAHPESSPRQRFIPHLFFNVGRIVGYTLLGAAIGVAGSAFRLSSRSTGVLTMFAGFVMLLLGLQLIEVFPRLRSAAITLPSGLARFLGVGNGPAGYSHRGAMVAGALTFFVPCGFTQAMQVAALGSGSPMTGALIMGGFALGTMPGLLTVGGAASFVRGAFANYFFKAVGVAVVALGIWNMSNGYNLTGFSALPVRNIVNVPGGAAEIANGAQIIRMTQSQTGYTPRQFSVRAGVPVRWVITSTNPYSCAVQLVAPAIGVDRILQLGENVIEFTPRQAGTIAFSCGMGMYRGIIRVTN